MKIIDSPTKFMELFNKRETPYKQMLKFVVDINKGVIAIDGVMHADLESLLLEGGSKQSNLWGGNIYSDRSLEDRLEFTSLINIRPSQANYSMQIEDASIRNQIKAIVDKLIK